MRRPRTDERGGLHPGFRARWTEVLGWLLTLPVLATAIGVGAFAVVAVGRFGELYEDLEAPIVGWTAVVLGLGGMGVAAIYGWVAAVAVVALVGSRRRWPKIAAPVACVAAMWALNGILVRALLTPLLGVLERLGG